MVIEYLIRVVYMSLMYVLMPLKRCTTYGMERGNEKVNPKSLSGVGFLLLSEGVMFLYLCLEGMIKRFRAVYPRSV